VFLLVPAHPGSSGQRTIKQLLLSDASVQSLWRLVYIAGELSCRPPVREKSHVFWAAKYEPQSLRSYSVFLRTKESHVLLLADLSIVCK